MNRREFVGTTIGTAVGGVTGTSIFRTIEAGEVPDDVRITRVVGFDLELERNKTAGKNSRLDVHGNRSRDRMLRLYTNTGVHAVGACRANERDVRKLLGRNPFDLFDAEKRQVAGPLGAGTMPVWDLVGRILKKPAYELLGGKGPERVPVYDGSIYFLDLLPEYQNDWKKRLAEEIELGRGLGHTAFKIKIGRGAKWMNRAEGDARDVELVREFRRLAGKDAIIGVDANNGYDLAGAKRFFDRTGDVEIAFAEEMFPETVKDCLAFKEYFQKQGRKTLLADGETQGELNAFKPFIKSKAIDVLQGDMNHFGFEGILKEAAWADPQEIQVAPHNWGSLAGYYMQLHVGRAIKNFYRAEHDPLSTDVLTSEGYGRKNGQATVSDSPGFGLEINGKKFRGVVRVRFDVMA